VEKQNDIIREYVITELNWPKPKGQNVLTAVRIGHWNDIHRFERASQFEGLVR
jgi:hypothetical protein